MTQPCPRQRHAVLPSQRDHVSHWTMRGECSYCGSIRPDELFAAIERGDEITPTDKSYKIYVGHTRKFYFQHLSEEEQVKFIDLCNEQKINLAYPGYFYVLPYFCEPVFKEDAQ